MFIHARIAAGFVCLPESQESFGLLAMHGAYDIRTGQARARSKVWLRCDGATVHCYAPGDGNLSFAVAYDGEARPYDVTDGEARAICPDGWNVYRDGAYHRAKRGPVTHYTMTHSVHVTARGGYVDPDRYKQGHRDYRPEMLCRAGDGHAIGTRDKSKVNCPRCLESLT